MEQGRAWIDRLPDELAGQQAIMRRLLAFSESDPDVCWLVIGCSVARGAGDRMSDLDMGIGVREEAFEATRDRIRRAADGLGDLVESYHHQLPGVPPPHERVFAQYADAWHAAFPDRPEELEGPVAALRRWCDEVGRDPADIEWGLGVEPEDIERFLARDAAVYVEMGFTQFTLGFNGPSWSVDGGVPFLRWRDQQNAAILAATAG